MRTEEEILDELKNSASLESELTLERSTLMIRFAKIEASQRRLLSKIEEVDTKRKEQKRKKRELFKELAQLDI